MMILTVKIGVTYEQLPDVQFLVEYLRNWGPVIHHAVTIATADEVEAIQRVMHMEIAAAEKAKEEES